MRFFDNKTEVLDIKLTRKGRKLLSEGGFKPKFYTFHDTNIIYDGRYGGVTEAQNDIETRIQEETPLMRTQNTFMSSDTLEDNGPISNLINTNEIQFAFPISKRTTLGAQKAPRWDLQLYDGRIVSASGYFTGSNEYAAPITQLDMLMKYRIRPYLSSEFEVLTNIDDPYRFFYFEDSSFLLTFPENIILDLQEENTPLENENFEIEVFRYENMPSSSFGTPRKLKKLNFIQRPVYIVDGVLLDKPIVPPDDFLINDSHVEYYFDVMTDQSIPTSELCDAVKKLKQRGIYIDSEFECPDLDSPYFPDIYGTNIEDSDIEDCE